DQMFGVVMVDVGRGLPNYASHLELYYTALYAQHPRHLLHCHSHLDHPLHHCSQDLLHQEPLILVPLNTPTRKHKRRKRRGDQGLTSPFRVLLGASVKLREESLKQKLADLTERNERIREAIRREKQANDPSLSVKLRRRIGFKNSPSGAESGNTGDIEGQRETTAEEQRQATRNVTEQESETQEKSSRDDSSKAEGSGGKTERISTSRTEEKGEVANVDIENELAVTHSPTTVSKEVSKAKEEGAEEENTLSKRDDDNVSWGDKEDFRKSVESFSKRRVSYKKATGNYLEDDI
ncbi:hypothetical protein SK128_025131, partial [Halocaridina rubra]